MCPHTLVDQKWKRLVKVVDVVERLHDPSTERTAPPCSAHVKEHAVPPCLVLVIDDNLYGLMVALSYI